MTATYGLDRGPGVLTVLAGSPAAFAGLVAGDVLLAVNGTPFLSPVAIAAEPKRRKWRNTRAFPSRRGDPSPCIDVGLEAS